MATSTGEIEAAGTRGELPRPRSIVSILGALILIVGVLYIGRLFFIALVSAVLLAFILEPLVNLMMRLRLPRGQIGRASCRERV